MILRLFCVTAAVSTVLANESMLDLRMAVDPFDAKNRSHIDIVSQASFKTPYCSLLVNPEIAFFLNKSVDFGISLGHRWELPVGILGHHIFFDRSQLPKISVNQIGTGIDLLTSKIDIRANYYHPVSPSVLLRDRIVKPCKWMEAEAMFKTPYFNLGVGPNLNIDSGVMGAQGRVIIPFERFSVGLGGMLDARGERQGFIITNFHLYRDKSGDITHTPLSHTKRPKIEFVPVHPNKNKKNSQPNSQNKKESPEEVVTDPEKINQIIKEKEDDPSYFLVEEETNNIPGDIPIDPETKTVWESIWDFFLGKKST